MEREAKLGLGHFRLQEDQPDQLPPLIGRELRVNVLEAVQRGEDNLLIDGLALYGRNRGVEFFEAGLCRGAPIATGALRGAFWGALAMAVTAAVGALFGVTT